MKKFLALLLALVMSLSLVACGGGDDTAADGGADAGGWRQRRDRRLSGGYDY